MRRPIEIYNLHIVELKKLDDIFQYNSKVLTTGIDISGLLRAEIVFAVSALDQYIHSVVLLRTMDILTRGEESTLSFNKLSLGLDVVNMVLKTENTADAFPIIEQTIAHSLSWKSFQQPDKIAEALRIICDKKIWDEVSALMGVPAKDIRERLQLIVKRRDSIAHEADFDVVNQCQYPINRPEVKESINFLIEIVYMIDSIIFAYSYDASSASRQFLG